MITTDNNRKNRSSTYRPVLVADTLRTRKIMEGNGFQPRLALSALSEASMLTAPGSKGTRPGVPSPQLGGHWTKILGFI